jgi:putative transcription factor
MGEEEDPFKPVILRKSKGGGRGGGSSGGSGASSSSAAKSQQAVNQAMRQGQPVETLKKPAAGSNKQLTGAQAAKLENETEEFKHEKVSQDLRKTIQQARQAKGWSQSDLAKQINENVKVVQEHERGGIPNQSVLAKMERQLGVKLRGNKKK